MTVGQRLRRARHRLGKTQSDIAKETGRTQPCVHAWEADQALPRTSELRTVAKAYGVRPERLIPEAA